MYQALDKYHLLLSVVTLEWLFNGEFKLQVWGSYP